MRREQRSAPATRLQSGGGLLVSGLAIPYNRLSEDLGGFREKFAPGSVRDVLERDDVRFMVSHADGAEGLAVARVSNGTLRLRDTEAGLLFSADLNPDMRASQDVLAAVERRDVDQMSFAFAVDPERGGEDRWHATDDYAVRTVERVSDLFELSVVAFAAYPMTTIAT
jgi:uncharacterized protein